MMLERIGPGGLGLLVDEAEDLGARVLMTANAALVGLEA
jgi:hypothetical protein